jgi:hypothetical protein
VYPCRHAQLRHERFAVQSQIGLRQSGLALQLGRRPLLEACECRPAPGVLAVPLPAPERIRSKAPPSRSAGDAERMLAGRTIDHLPVPSAGEVYSVLSARDLELALDVCRTFVEWLRADRLVGRQVYLVRHCGYARAADPRDMDEQQAFGKVLPALLGCSRNDRHALAELAVVSEEVALGDLDEHQIGDRCAGQEGEKRGGQGYEAEQPGERRIRQSSG